MSSGEWIDLVIGSTYVVLAVTMLASAHRAGVAGTGLLWVLTALFSLRAASRIGAALDVTGRTTDRVIDVLTLGVLVALLVVIRELVAALHARRDELERTQVEYDQALKSMGDDPDRD